MGTCLQRVFASVLTASRDKNRICSSAKLLQHPSSASNTKASGIPPSVMQALLALKALKRCRGLFRESRAMEHFKQQEFLQQRLITSEQFTANNSQRWSELNRALTRSRNFIVVTFDIANFVSVVSMPITSKNLTIIRLYNNTHQILIPTISHHHQ